MSYVKAFLIMFSIVTVLIGLLCLIGLWADFILTLKLPERLSMMLTLAPVVVPWFVWMTILLGRLIGRKP